MTTSTEAGDLVAVPDGLFERVWEFVKAFDERERHFNDIQVRYRSLASTWLLAAFAGMAIAFSSDLQPDVPVSRAAIAMAVALAGAVGLFLLWVVDILVYHELLIASYVAGKKLEWRFRWLPPIRTRFHQRERATRWAVRHYIALFYLVGIEVLCLVSLLVGWRTVDGSWWLAPLLVGGILAIFILWLTKRSIDWKEKLEKAAWAAVEGAAAVKDRPPSD